MSDRHIDLSQFLGEHDDHGHLLCGQKGCNGDFSMLHPNEVRTFFGEVERMPAAGKDEITEEDVRQGNFRVVSRVKSTVVDRKNLDGYSEYCEAPITRGVLIRVLFGCETCGGETALFFHFHKGSTHTWTEYLPRQEFTGGPGVMNDHIRTIWRD